MSELIVMISQSDRFLHVGTATQLIEHVHPGPEGEGRTEPVDLYDANGDPLMPVVGRNLTVVGFRAVPGAPADPDVVFRRIQAVLDHARTSVTDDPQLTDSPGRTVPDMEGTLPEVLEALHHELELDIPNPHAAGWFHNLMHKIG